MSWGVSWFVSQPRSVLLIVVGNSFIRAFFNIFTSCLLSLIIIWRYRCNIYFGKLYQTFVFFWLWFIECCLLCDSEHLNYTHSFLILILIRIAFVSCMCFVFDNAVLKGTVGNICPSFLFFASRWFLIIKVGKSVVNYSVACLTNLCLLNCYCYCKRRIIK